MVRLIDKAQAMGAVRKNKSIDDDVLFIVVWAARFSTCRASLVASLADREHTAGEKPLAVCLCVTSPSGAAGARPPILVQIKWIL